MYGGTKTEMERLLKDAETLTGKKYDVSNFGHIVEAIHAIQTQMGIAGTTAKEASTTVQGSLNMFKASWQDLLVAMASPSEELSKSAKNAQEDWQSVEKTIASSKVRAAVKRLTDSLKIMLKNMLPVIKNFISGFGDFIADVAPMIGEQLPLLIADFLPKFVEAGVGLVQGLGRGLSQAASKIAPMLPQIFESILTGFLTLVREVANNIIGLLNEAFNLEIPELDLSFIQNSFQWFVDNKETIVAAIGAIVAAFVATNIANFVSSISPLTLIFTLIAGGIALVAKNWDKIKDWIGKTWNTVVTWVQEKWDDVQAAFDVAKEWLGKAWTATVTWAQEKWENVKRTFTLASSAVQKGWNAVVNWAQQKWDAISNAFAEAGKWVGKTWDTTVNWVQTAWDDVSKALADVGAWVGEKTNNIKLKWNSTVDTMTKTIDGWLTNTGLKQIVLDFGATIAEWIETIGNWLLGNGLDEITIDFGATVADWIKTIAKWASDGINVAVNFFQGVGSTISDIFNGEGNGERSSNLTGFGSGVGGARMGGSAPGAARNTQEYMHAKGSWAIPYDNYPALLHRNEMVLTASQANKLRNGGMNNFDSAAIAEAVRGAVMELTMELNGETVGRVFGNATTRRVRNNISQINRRHQYGYGG